MKSGRCGQSGEIAGAVCRPCDASSIPKLCYRHCCGTDRQSNSYTAVQEDRIQLFTSQALIDELRDVLGRPKCSRRLLESANSVGRLLILYLGVALLVDPILVPRIAPDPDDDVVIGTALAAKADLIVTGDHALLSVGEYEGVRIVSVLQALDVLGPET